MKHTEAKAFVRKYNSELAIRGYSKMKKADLAATIERKLDQSREELKREWTALKAGPKPMAVKQGQKARQTGIKSGTPARRPAPPVRPKVGPRAKRAAVKKPTAAEKRRAEYKADDSWHSRNKDSSGMAQANRVTSAISRIERRAAVQRDMALARRIRGPRY